MMFPILLKVRYESLHLILSHRGLYRHLLFSILINWILAPLLMLAVSWAFLPDRRELREGLILVGIARCIAMVLVWTNLAGGDEEYCAILVAANSLLQMVLFAPLSILYIRIISPGSAEFAISYSLVAKSVSVFLGIPLGAAVVVRLVVRGWVFHGDEERWQKHFVRWVAPWSLIGLLFTIVVLFAAQAKHIRSKIVDVVRVAAPLVVYFLVIFGVVLVWARWGSGRRRREGPEGAKRRIGRWEYGKTVVQCLTAASNNFELAIAVAVGVWGVESGQALAATVGPLIEVPVLLGLVEVLKVVRRRWEWDREGGEAAEDGEKEGDRVSGGGVVERAMV